MNAVIGNIAQASAARLLRPLVSVLLRYGVPFGAFMEIAKRVYVEVAMAEFAIPGRKPSNSRASVITGLSRKEVLRIRRLPPLSDDAVQDRYNRATRVISGWVRDGEFNTRDGGPAPLPFTGSGASFSSLVRKYSGDVPARAILDELLRVHAVQRLDNGDIQLRTRAYIPADGDEEKLGILGSDVSDLIRTIDHNIQVPPEQSRFQLKVAYDNLPREPLGRFRTLSSRRAMRLLEQLDKELSGFDRDTNPASQGTGRVRAGISIYYFEEEVSDGEAEANP